MTICAIIVTFNIDCQTLQTQTTRLCKQVDHICIVDNGSSGTDLLEYLRHLNTLPNFKIFFNTRNTGIAAALNTGVQFALTNSFDFILTLDHDSIPDIHMVKRLYESFLTLSEHSKQHPPAIVCPKIIHAGVPRQNTPARKKRLQRRETAISSGCLMHADIFHKVGFFFEPLFIYYVDDDFCLRCKKHRLAIFRDHTAMLFHREGEKTVHHILGCQVIYRKYSANALFYITRNTVFMLRRYACYPFFCLACIKRVLVDIILIRLFDPDHRIKFASMREGMRNGLKGVLGPAKTVTEP